MYRSDIIRCKKSGITLELVPNPDTATAVSKSFGEMSAKRIRIDAESETSWFNPLGRPVCVGDFYAYPTDVIKQRNSLSVPSVQHLVEEHSVSNSGRRFSYFFRQSEVCKLFHLGISPHQKSSIRGVSRDACESWFRDYLDYRPPDDSAFVVLHMNFRGYRKFISDVGTLLSNVDLNTDATHVISEIVYGSNGLVILEHPVNGASSLQVMEDNLFLAVKNLEKGQAVPQSISSLVKCRFYCDSPQVEPLSGTLDDFLVKLNEIINLMNSSSSYIPVSATIVPVSSSQAQFVGEQRVTDTALMFTALQTPITTYVNDCFSILQDPFISRIKRLKYYLEHFLSCLTNYTDATHLAMNSDRRWEKADLLQYLTDLWHTYHASGALSEWVIRRKRGVEIIKRLLGDIDIPLVPLKTVTNTTDRNAMSRKKKIFILKTTYHYDQVLQKFYQDFGPPESPKWSVLEIVSSPESHIEFVRTKLLEFASEIDNGEPFQRFISSSSSHIDGSILIIPAQCSVPNAQETLFMAQASSAGSSTPRNPSQPRKPIQSATINDASDNIAKKRGTRGSVLLIKGHPSVYLLSKVNYKTDLSTNLRWYELGLIHNATSAEHKTVIVMGPVGSGKSELIVNLINYIRGVEWSDTYRFRMVIEEEVTGVVAYTFYAGTTNIPFTLSIIDTPGYTGDDLVDLSISNSISTCLAHENSAHTWKTVNAVCLVADSNQKLMSPALENVLNAIPTIFDENGVPEVLWFCTHATVKNTPLVLEAIPPTIPIKTDTYYKIDNSVLFVCNVGEVPDTRNTEIWEMNWKSFRAFENRLKGIQVVEEAEPEESAIPTQREWSDEQLRMFDNLSELDVDIEIALARLESSFKSSELMKSLSVDTIEMPEHQQALQECHSILKLFEAAAKLCFTLKATGFRKAHVRKMRFKTSVPKANDYISYVRNRTRQSPLRRKILDLLTFLTRREHESRSPDLEVLQAVTVKQEPEMVCID